MDTIKNQIEGCKKQLKFFSETLTEKKKELDTLLKKSTPEQKRKVERFKRRVAHCIKNNNAEGLELLKKNFTL